LTAILSADVKGYSRLMGDDEESTVRTLNAYREIMAASIRQHEGRVVDATGDNLLAEFSSVVNAVQCAVEIQKELRARNAELPENRRMEFRIGVNLGDVVVEGERIYGDGVNIAARLEGLAEPGGVCISGTVHDQIENKLSLSFKYLGNQTVKNIKHPVRVYAIKMGPRPTTPKVAKSARRKLKRRFLLVAIVVLLVFAAVRFATRRTSRHPPMPRRVAQIIHQARSPKLPDKPSIAVLPFVNMSGDSEQEYFSDGLTEDLITALSKVSGLFVISRNAVFTYKGKAAKPTQVSKELGVRYILEGSVRKADETVRISAQLIDATTGGHLWAERYDRDLEDIFALQDEVTEKIVTALASRLPDTAEPISEPSETAPEVKPAKVEKEPEKRRASGNLRAYDYFWRGRYYLQRYTKDANDHARSMFEKAIELDSELAAAYMGLGWTYYNDWAMQWSRDPQSLERAFALAKRAIALDDSLAPAHSLLGHVYLWKKQYEEAIAEKERAIAIDPNDADGYSDLAEVLIWGGKPEDAIGLVEKAIRLNPHYPVNYLYTLGYAYFATGQYEEAIAAEKEALTRNPDFLGSHLILIAIYSKLGQEEKARAHVAEALRINPQLSLEVWRERLPFKDQADLEGFLDALRKLGLE